MSARLGRASAVPVNYGAPIEAAIDRIDELLEGDYGLSSRSVGLLLLQGDVEIHRLVREREPGRYDLIARIVRETEAMAGGEPLTFAITMARQATIEGILTQTVSFPEAGSRSLADLLGRLTTRPLTGVPILILVLYFGLYQFVGVLGAGTLVGLLEENLFGEVVNPWVTGIVTSIVPWAPLQDLLVGEYGVITLAFTYAFAIILPVVGTFFLVFSVIEDSGYLPRLALLIDRLFKLIGLNGRAVIPLVLGFGCDTMATIVTRVLETRRERVIATLLMALAIPCSAQLGVVLGLLAFNPAALLIWIGVVGLTFVLVGYLAAKLLPGEAPSFYMELPPLRLPQLRNVLVKTYTRMEWYFFEVLPIFVLASVLIWLGQLTGAFDAVIGALGPVMAAMGLPVDAAVVFLFGFFRRDYGAAGLYDLVQDGTLGGVQVVVAAVTLTLFVPCVAQFSVMLKERGWRSTLAIVAFIFPFAFAVGFGLNALFGLLGVTL